MKMSIILSTKGKDQLFLQNYWCLRDRLTPRCVKNNCKGRARHSGTTHEMNQSHACQAPNPEEIKKSV